MVMRHLRHLTVFRHPALTCFTSLSAFVVHFLLSPIQISSSLSVISSQSKHLSAVFHLILHLTSSWVWVVPSESAPVTQFGAAAAPGGWVVSVQFREVSVASPSAAALCMRAPMGITTAWGLRWHPCPSTRACWLLLTWRSIQTCPWAEPTRRSRSRASTTALQPS